MTDAISPSDFEQAEGAADWRVVSDGATAYFPTPSFVASARRVEAVSELAGLDDDPPAVDVRKGGVTFTIVTLRDDYMGMTRANLDLAARISAIAREQGLTADPNGVQGFLVIPGAPAIGEVMPFWRAVLGYVPRPDSPAEDLVDPLERTPPLWFETMDEPRPGGLGAIHVAVWLPQELAEARVTAALAAGGHMVRDEYAPSWWTLADAAGNEVDVSSIANRG